MSKTKEKARIVAPPKSIPCCPTVNAKQACNAMDFTYRIQREVSVANGRSVTVEMLIKAKLEVCRGDLTLGKLAYSNTLLPGEKVRLFTRDRRNSFSFDSETNLSYRQEQSYEEQYYLSAMNEFMSDLSVNERTSASASSSGSFSGKAESKGLLGSIFGGPGVKSSGNYSAEATADFLRELRVHAESSHYRSEQATHTINSVSIGEVNTRTHVEGESEDHFEASSRVFSNPNRCHAVTYYFYQLNQEQTIRFSIVSVQRRVIDTAADTSAEKRPRALSGDVSVIPAAVLATSSKRLAVEEADRVSLANKAGIGNLNLSAAPTNINRLTFASSFASTQAPLTSAERSAAMAKVDHDLVAAGILDKKSKELSESLKKELSFEFKTQLPTNGMYLRTCLDECPACEPAMMEEIKLDLEQKRLQNELLKKQIDLLEKSQDYRCCPEPKTDEETE